MWVASLWTTWVTRSCGQRCEFEFADNNLNLILGQLEYEFVDNHLSLNYEWGQWLELWVWTTTWVTSVDNDVSFKFLDNDVSSSVWTTMWVRVSGQQCVFKCLENVILSVWTTWFRVFGQRREFECLDNDVSLSVWSGDNDVSLEWGQWCESGVGTITWVCRGDNDASLQWGQWRESAVGTMTRVCSGDNDVSLHPCCSPPNFNSHHCKHS